MSSAGTRRRICSACMSTRESRVRCGWERSASLMLETSDVLVLARLQFAFTISAHIIFPAISIGLANYLAVLEGLWLRTGKLVYRELYFFWSKIFAVGFGMGVVSGVVMAYEFAGANWVQPLPRRRLGCQWTPAHLRGPVGSFPRRPVSSASCCSAGSASVHACIFSPRCWSHSVRCFRRFGSSLRTAGCRRPKASSSWTGELCRSTG